MLTRGARVYTVVLDWNRIDPGLFLFLSRKLERADTEPADFLSPTIPQAVCRLCKHTFPSLLSAADGQQQQQQAYAVSAAHAHMLLQPFHWHHQSAGYWLWGVHVLLVTSTILGSCLNYSLFQIYSWSSGSVYGPETVTIWVVACACSKILQITWLRLCYEFRCEVKTLLLNIWNSGLLVFCFFFVVYSWFLCILISVNKEFVKDSCNKK